MTNFGSNALGLMSRFKNEERARVVLVLLVEEPSGSANENVLAAVLNDLAIGGTRADLRTAFEDLERKGLVRCSDVGGVWILELSEHGEEVAQHRVMAEGVARRRRD